MPYFSFHACVYGSESQAALHHQDYEEFIGNNDFEEDYNEAEDTDAEFSKTKDKERIHNSAEGEVNKIAQPSILAIQTSQALEKPALPFNLLLLGKQITKSSMKFLKQGNLLSDVKHWPCDYDLISLKTLASYLPDRKIDLKKGYDILLNQDAPKPSNQGGVIFYRNKFDCAYKRGRLYLIRSEDILHSDTFIFISKRSRVFKILILGNFSSFFFASHAENFEFSIEIFLTHLVFFFDIKPINTICQGLAAHLLIEPKAYNIY